MTGSSKAAGSSFLFICKRHWQTLIDITLGGGGSRQDPYANY
jgi:hypothetical protein